MNKKNIVKLLSFVLVISGLSPLTSLANANGVDGACGSFEFAGGDGSSSFPYQIHNVYALNELRDCANLDGDNYSYYELTADISLSGTWTPIPEFYGDLNGNGFELSNINIAASSNMSGFFGLVFESVIQDVTFSGSVSNSGNQTGLIAGCFQQSEITNVDVYSEVTGTTLTGGAFGSFLNSTMDDLNLWALDNDAKVSSNGGYTGGLVGLSNESVIKNSSSRINIDVSGWSQGIGGIAGNVFRSAVTDSDENLYYQGTISALDNGAYQCGGIAGNTEAPIVQAVVEDSTITCESHDVGGIAGYSSNTIDQAWVDADINIIPVDDSDGFFEAGGIVGWWSPRLGTMAISESSFRGSITNVVLAGGLIGVMDVSSLDSQSDVNFSLNYVNATINNQGYAAGIIGELIYDSDAEPENRPVIDISQTYTKVIFGNDVQEKDPLVYSDFSFRISDLIWIDANQGVTPYLGENAGVSRMGLAESSYPGFWREANFDQSNNWGMSTEKNDGLPVLRYLNDLDYDVVCDVKKFPDVRFAKNSVKLTKAAKKQLNKFATEISTGYCTHVAYLAFASSKETKKGKGKKNYQLGLAIQRLFAVSNYLELKFADFPVLIKHDALALGAKRLKNKDKTAMQQALNRRVEIRSVY